MSGHNSRSRSPSTGANGRGHSPSFGQQMAPSAMDPSMFNNSPYQAGVNFQNQGQYMDNQFLGDMPGGQQYDNSYGDPFNKGLGVNGAGLMVDPSLQDVSVNPGDVMGGDQMSPTSVINQGMGSQHHSPAMSPAQFGHRSPSHSRNQSLDPSSAAFGQGLHGEWHGHRRSPSEHSDVSSAAHSPFPTTDSFDLPDGAHSPMMNPTMGDPSLYDQGLDMNRLNFQEAQRRASISAQNSPYISPNLVPVQPNNGLNPDGQFVLPSNAVPQEFSHGDIGQADNMPAPSIQIEEAPAQNPMLMGESQNSDALSPPIRGRTIRNRAKSDITPMISRPLTPGDLSPNLMQSPSHLDAGLNQPHRHRSLSPFDATFPSNYRSASPGSNRSSRRSSTSSINPNRDYILELADPNRPGASGPGTGTRVQKHPATFQCTMCPKRFTRAYNLRSHLRTHTDERPFVCSVCGKAFARQHDRKRHEGLHSGEKKFVCKGDLSHGQGQWGCGRRFARADALGRHFRSEAGRVCIKPLLDEEMAEKRRAYEQQVLAGAGMPQMGQMPPSGMPPPPGVLPSQGPGVDLSMAPTGQPQFALPQAILMQYPALQGLQWDQISGNQSGMEDDDGGISGRSSFDASGGGDDYDDGYVSGPGTMYGAQVNGGWVSDQGM